MERDAYNFTFRGQSIETLRDVTTTFDELCVRGEAEDEREFQEAFSEFCSRHPSNYSLVLLAGGGEQDAEARDCFVFRDQEIETLRDVITTLDNLWFTGRRDEWREFIWSFNDLGPSGQSCRLLIST